MNTNSETNTNTNSLMGNIGSALSGLKENLSSGLESAKQGVSGLANSASQYADSASEYANSAKNAISEQTSRLGLQTPSINTNNGPGSSSIIPANLAGSTLLNFSLSNYANMSSEFLESNSLVAKIAFLLLVVFMFFVLLRLISGLISYFMNSSNFNPTKLIDGMINANEAQEFQQSPAVPANKTIYRSSNESAGIEFSWSTYLFIRDLDTSNSLKHVFHKGNYNIDSTTGVNSPNNAPGLYIKSDTTTKTVSLQVIMSTYQTISETITVPNIPLNKWINVVIRCQNLKMDVYVNGLIAQSYQLTNVPKQNYGSVYVAQNGGFPGFISNLFYYNYALTISEIQRLNNYGPKLVMTTSSTSQNLIKPDYLSLKWYTNQ